MCYTKQVSQDAFLINMVSCYILYYYHTKTYDNSYKIFALFFAFVGLMQLFDWIFWNNQVKNNINFTTTKIAMIANHLQPIVLSGLIYLFNKKLSNNSIIILIVYIVYGLYYSINVYNITDYTLVTEQSSPSLDWKWNSLGPHPKLMYGIFLITFILLSLENLIYPMNILLAFICGLSFVFASYYYKGVNIGRFWCHYSSYIPLLILFIANIKSYY